MKLAPELLEKFSRLLSALSPEILSCDGELSDRDVDRRRALLMREWRMLEKEAGRTITQDEIISQDFSDAVEGELDGRKRSDAQDIADEMDGDHTSALASAGFGTDEDYGGTDERL